MCGRYSLTRRGEEILERFSIQEILMEREHLKPRYNIAPSQMVTVVINKEGHRVLAEFKWGLIPFWAKEAKATKALINARCETVAEKPFFKKSLNKRRCLIPADGFYEWKRENKEKIPMYIQVKDQDIFSFAGLWDEWTSPEGEVIRTCTIITTNANEPMSGVHDRMPVIIRLENEAIWLDPDIKDPAILQSLLQPLDDQLIQMHEVSSRVNSPKQDTADLIERVLSQPKIWDLQKPQ